mgnify:CR=1 FL=1|tara:strand:+ start:529 stop:984 length:456 start_codon:yes stop_codon:yes gene_type:complete
MVKIVKDLYITEIKISNISNAPFVIEAIDSYTNSFTINEEILNNWDIVPSKKLIGKSLLLTLESIESTDKDSDIIQINYLEKIVRRRFRYLPSPSHLDEIEFLMSSSTPRTKSEPDPCPFFEILISLKESEYKKLNQLPVDVSFKLSCQVR